MDSIGEVVDDVSIGSFQALTLDDEEIQSTTDEGTGGETDIETEEEVVEEVARIPPTTPRRLFDDAAAAPAPVATNRSNINNNPNAMDVDADEGTTINNRKPKAIYSVAHDDIVNGRAVMVHVDLEHGGEGCGILQLSAVMVDMTNKNQLGQFDQYVNPGPGAVCSSNATAVHGLTAARECIQKARGIVDVWRDFVTFVESHLDGGNKKGIITAWGGKSCDCEWLFRVTEETHHGILKMPRWCPYFLDPRRVIEKYKTCELNQQHSRVLGYGLEEVYCFDDEDTDWDTDEDSNNNNDDRAPIRKSRWGLMPCDEKDEGARHRFKPMKGIPWRTVTPGFVLVCLGTLLQFGASGPRRADFAWSEEHCNQLPHIQNSCTRNAWHQIRRCIHFVDTSSLHKKGGPLWTPLQKIQPWIDMTLKSLQRGWVMGKKMWFCALVNMCRHATFCFE